MNVASGRLCDRVVLVTGASRGLGKAIAVTLGAEGASVYLTARSTNEVATVPLPGSIECTADIINGAGGHAVPIVCDHSDDGQVRGVINRIRKEVGGLDILVNNAWAGYQQLQRGLDGFERPFWELSPSHWDDMFEVGVRSTYVASALAIPLMLDRPAALIVNISSYAGFKHSFNAGYGVAKAAVDRMSRDMAIELNAAGVSVVSMWPGTVRTEMNELVHPPDYSDSESPYLAAEGIVCLACDPLLQSLSGSVVETRRLTRRYGFRDVDGSLPNLHRGLFGDGSVVECEGGNDERRS